MNHIDTLTKALEKIQHLKSASSLAHFDMETAMPPQGAPRRAEMLAELSGRIHNDVIALGDNGLLDTLTKMRDAGKLSDTESALVREVARDVERESTLPEDFVRTLSETTATALNVWKDARASSDFSLFAPYLETIIDLKREQCEYYGYSDNPYNALLEEYEPGETTEHLDSMFSDLKAFTIPLLQSIIDSGVTFDASKLGGTYPLAVQKECNDYIAGTLGFDFSAGVTAVSTHPFSTAIVPRDVRFTSRYRESDALYAIGSTIHETGHGLYEQGLPDEYYGTPLANFLSLGIHESQSRLWEKIVGSSEEFFEWVLPVLNRYFPASPFVSVSSHELYRIHNAVSPSFIRTESDEVTYNLHIILRYELEKALINKEITVKDIPYEWNKKVKEYLGLEVTNDAEGCLQDIHWSLGSLGYFPTYTLGNLYSAQMFSALKKKIPNVGDSIRKGEFSKILLWLRENIHKHGRRFSQDELIRTITGEPLTSGAYKEYIRAKYSSLYSLNL